VFRGRYRGDIPPRVTCVQLCVLINFKSWSNSAWWLSVGPGPQSAWEWDVITCKQAQMAREETHHLVLRLSANNQSISTEQWAHQDHADTTRNPSTSCQRRTSPLNYSIPCSAPNLGNYIIRGDPHIGYQTWTYLKIDIVKRLTCFKISILRHWS